ncbi:MAG: hypothetical protein CRU78_06285 [Candidatus Accumulibacter phosphatis]|uniref:Glycine-zipper-containing OmpA-like membrane domain-containing protein n=1 Tax=Candidatus Accumulibacter phosphatis TaxID=327160 RepID=A0A6A7RTC9_9PROT|nr:hypothetical protein [Candidatus Accumulibacter phosphatis]
MKSSTSVFALAGPLILLAGCVSVPSGPSMMALPGSGKSFDQFRLDDTQCREYAQMQIGGSDANQAATEAGVRSAAVGTVVGALAGAAIGGSQGAGVGAGTGLLVGSVAGTGAAQSSAYASQRHYDHAYIQCMYAKGEQVPTAGVISRRHVPVPDYAPTARAYPAPAAGYPPAPPSGYPPPPPPDVYPAER